VIGEFVRGSLFPRFFVELLRLKPQVLNVLSGGESQGKNRKLKTNRFSNQENAIAVILDGKVFVADCAFART